MTTFHDIMLMLEIQIDQKSDSRDEYEKKLKIIDIIIRGLEVKYDVEKLSPEDVADIRVCYNWIKSIINCQFNTDGL